MPGMIGTTPQVKEKVSDIIPYFRARKRFKPDDSKTYVTALDFDDSGELVAVCRTDDTLQIYNCSRSSHAKELRSQKYGIDLVRFTHHSRAIIYASTKVNNDIRYLNTHDNVYQQYFKGHEKLVTCLTMCPGSDQFISCSEDDTLRIWDLNIPNAKGTLHLKGAYLAAFDPTGSIFAAASSYSNELLLYDIRNFDKAPFATFDLQSYEQHYNKAVEKPSWTKLEFSNDGKSILVGTSAYGHYVIDSFEGHLNHFCRRTSPSERRVPGSTAPSKIASQGDVTFSPCGRFLVGGSGTSSGAVVWDLAPCEGAENPLKAAHNLPFPSNVNDKVDIIGYNPRFNHVVTAGQSVMMWYPDSELYGPLDTK